MAEPDNSKTKVEIKEGILYEDKPGQEPVAIALDTLPIDLQEQISEYAAERESLGNVTAEKSHMLERKAKEIVEELEDEDKIEYNLDPWIHDEEKMKHKIVELELMDDYEKKEKEKAKKEDKTDDKESKPEAVDD